MLFRSLDAPLRVLVEAGYNRSISPGQATSWNPLYMPNPVKLTHDFLLAIPTGLDNAFEDTMGIRPFKTVRPGPYGVGGPSVTETEGPLTNDDATPESTTETSAATKTAAAAVAASAKDAKKSGQESVVKHTDATDPKSAADDQDAVTSGKPQAGTDTPSDATADGKTTQSPGDAKGDGSKQGDDSNHADTPKRKDDDKRPPRHTLSGKPGSESAKETRSTASTSAASDSGAKKAGPRHAR